MKTSLEKIAVLAFASGVLALGACGGAGQASGPPPNTIALSDQFSSNFELIDTAGSLVRDEDLKGKPAVIYFGFTNCPDVCPIDSAALSAALNELGDEAEKLTAVFITVDPERDTPEALGTFLSFDERIIGLTGSPEAAEAARDAFKLFAQKRPLPGSAIGYTMDHGRFFYILDRQAQPKFALPGGGSPQELAELLRYSIKM